MKNTLFLLAFFEIMGVAVFGQGQQAVRPDFLDSSLFRSKSKIDSLEAIILTLTTQNKELENNKQEAVFGEYQSKHIR